MTRLGWNTARESQLLSLGDPALIPARIVRVDRGLSLAQTEEAIVRCTSDFHGAPVTVGDWVALEDLAGGEFLRVSEVLPRTSMLERSGGAIGAQAIAANVDFVFILQPCDGLNARRLERELAQVWASGASPVVILSKSDAVADASELLAEAGRVGRGVAVHATSSLTGEGVGDIAAYFDQNATCGLIGPSGAGKSTLANALLGEELMATAEVRADDRRGRHTTTARHLLPLPGGGALVDTPGMREFGLTGDSDAIHAVFTDISGVASNCRFRDCRHHGEPGCAVAVAIDSGEIENDRLASYRKLEKEQEAWRARNDPIARKEREQRWKSIARGTRQRKKFGGKWS